MQLNSSVGTTFIRENSILPGDLIIETEAFAPGWRAVRNYDGYALGRKIEEAKWNFCYLAGAVKAFALGRMGRETLRRTMRSILAKPEGQRFNAAETPKIGQRWFPGFPFVSIAANFRKIQQSLVLAPTDENASGIPAAAGKAMDADKYGALIPNS